MNLESESKTELHLTMGKWYVTKDKSYELIAPSLGSCVAICLYDTENKIGAMAHVVLPSRQIRKYLPSYKDEKSPSARYADEVVDLLLKELRKVSLNNNLTLVAKIAGGAQMFKGIQQKHAGNNEQHFPMIGQSNSRTLQRELVKHKIPIIGSDVGGTSGRTVTFNICNGKVLIRHIGEGKEIFI
jgi:chemotaxis protein CheD